VSTAREALLSFARCFGVDNRKAVYVSSPITTGRSLLDWRQQESAITESHPRYSADHRKYVVQANITKARLVVGRVRAAFPTTVIDPTRLDDVDDWKQADYHQFWADLVARFVHTVVFVDGWHFSTGCAVEFATAVRNRLTLLDERLQQLDPAYGVKLLATAAHELGEAGLDVTPLTRAAADAHAALQPQ
jgi:hypothetical protein